MLRRHPRPSYQRPDAPARRLWTPGCAQRAIVSRPPGALPNTEPALRKKRGPKKKQQVVLLQRPNLNPTPPHPTLAALFLFFFYAGEYLLMRQRQGGNCEQGRGGRRRGCWDVGGEANMADIHYFFCLSLCSDNVR